jgi:tRNA (guanine-N7-)-methyltransferase
VQTDNVPYWQYLSIILPHYFDFAEQAGPWPDAHRGRTRREIIALRRGLSVHRGIGTAKPLSPEQRSRLATELPPPDFDAGPNSRELDQLERSERPA